MDEEHDTKYPLHAKARLLQREMSELGEFLEFLERTGRLADEGVTQEHMKFENIIGEYFEIDYKAFSAEKDRMADEASAAYEQSQREKAGAG